MGAETHLIGWICVCKLETMTAAWTVAVSQKYWNKSPKGENKTEGWCCTEFPCYDTTAPFFSSAAHIAFGCPVSDCAPGLLLYHRLRRLNPWQTHTHPHTSTHQRTLLQVLNQAIHPTVAIVTAATLSPSDNLLHIKNLLSTTNSTLPHTHTFPEKSHGGLFWLLK